MGSVTLVGAGCGKGLITLKGFLAVQNADVIVYDDLLDGELLNAAKDDAEKIYVGKRSGKHSETQDKINRLLIEKAKEGHHVVRLKGGDSFVFGRGGEEIAALQKEHIPYEVIPGVSSAIAVPENAGIPVTHRGVSQAFTVVTGHTATDHEENYEALAKLSGTIVFLMGLRNIETICGRLMQNGKDPDTPAAILSDGFGNNERRIDGTLATIAQKAKFARTPAVLVIGKTAGLDFRKTIQKPLDGISVTVTGTKDFAYKTAEKLLACGARVAPYATIRIIPKNDDIPADFTQYTHLVFTSSTAVRIFFESLKNSGTDFRKISFAKFACIGKGTAKTLASYGFYADFIPTTFTAETLGKELATTLNRDDRLLLLRAENGSDAITEELNQAHIRFDDRKIYAAKAETIAINCDTDYITFASAEGVKAFFENGGRLNGATPVCIGAITAKALKKHSGIIPVIAETHTADGIIRAILNDISEDKP